MTTLLFQCLAILITSIISIYSLQKDFKSSQKYIHKNALIARGLIFFFTAVSLLVTILTYFDSEQDKDKLTNSLSSIKTENERIRKQNDTLRNTLDKNSISTSNLIVKSQLQSAKQLNKAASKLIDILNGSNKPPVFSFVGETEDRVIGMCENYDSLPVFEFSARVINLTGLQQCSLKKLKDSEGYSVTGKCFNDNSIWIDNLTELRIGEQVATELPKMGKLGSGKYLVKVNMKNKFYYEEAIYKFFKGNMIQSTRILELSKDSEHTIKSWVAVKVAGSILLKNVDWQKEFPQGLIHKLFISP